MSRTCTVCSHAARGAIDQALVVGSPSLRVLATRYGLEATAIYRHGQNHLSQSLTQAKAAADVADADTLLERLQRLLERADEQYGVARGLVARAVKADDLRSATGALVAGNGAIREARSILALLLEVEGQIDRRPQITIVTDPGWLRVRGELIDALSQYPDVAVIVAERLLALEASA